MITVELYTENEIVTGKVDFEEPAFIERMNEAIYQNTHFYIEVLSPIITSVEDFSDSEELETSIMYVGSNRVCMWYIHQEPHLKAVE